MREICSGSGQNLGFSDRRLDFWISGREIRKVELEEKEGTAAITTPSLPSRQSRKSEQMLGAIGLQKEPLCGSQDIEQEHR